MNAHHLGIPLLSLSLLALSAGAEEGTNLVASTWVDEVRQRLHGSATIDYRNGFTLRGVVLTSRSTSVKTANFSYDGGGWGSFGGNVIAASALDLTGCPIIERNWFTAMIYNAYYGQSIRLAEGWALDARAFRNWMTHTGFIGDIPTLCHWGGSLDLKNPYVTPYAIFRWADRGQEWTYWELGVRKPWRVLEGLTLTPTVFCDLGDGRIMRAQYRDNPNRADGSYSSGLMAVNVALYADYALTDYLSLTAFIHEFVTVNADGRDALDTARGKNRVKDMTLFGVGLKLKF